MKFSDVRVLEEQPMSECFESLHIGRDADEDEVGLSGDIIALLDVRVFHHPSLKSLQLVEAFAMKFHHHDESDILPHRLRIELGNFAFDQAALLQPADSALHRCDREPGCPNERFERRLGILLKVIEDDAI
nr:hypothetical protein [Pacificimonas pallii]